MACQDWRKLYADVLLETDSQRLPSRIDEAEKALILRGRELSLMSGDNSEEGDAVEDALYLLRSLRNCLILETRESKAA
jgi:hypothetical protein